MTGYRWAWITILLLVLLSVSGPAFSQSSAGDATIQNVTYAGESAVEPDRNGTFVWRDGPHEFVVTVSSGTGLDDGKLCLRAVPDDGTAESELACQALSVPAGESVSATVEFPDWPSDEVGEQSVRTVVRSSTDDRALAESSTDLTVLERGGDVDDDGLSNERELSRGTDLWRNDTDDDGLADGIEVDAFETDPTSNDTDGDGLLDREELRTYETDPTAADTDGDGLDDAFEVANGTDPNVADTDGDGLDDALEVNTYGTNATAADTDGDGLSDGAEVNAHGTNPTKADTDGDGLADNLEVNTYDTDPNAIDSDGDGLQDGREVSEYRTDPTSADTDADGLTDGQELNIHDTNPNKADTDGDGLDDGAEVNRYETDPNAADTDGDGVSDPEEVARSETFSSTDLAVLAVAGVVAVLAAGTFAVRSNPFLLRYVPGVGSGADRRATDDVDDSRAQDEGQDRPGDASPAETATTGGRGVDSGTEPTSPAVKGEGGVAESGPDAANLDLLPNSEAVLTVLERNDGQIRQSTLVEETGWSKAKVSRVLSQMEADDKIVKVSIGRGNLITTPGDVPSGAQSPFED